jgi:hypothetical protein
MARCSTRREVFLKKNTKHKPAGNMTAEEIKKLVFHLDGLKYSFQMARLVSKRIRETLDEIAKDHPDKYTEEQITSGLLDAWTIIDICHRVRSIVQGMPGLARKLPEIQIYLRKTDHVEGLRNYVQHFRSEISNIPLESNPLWGALSWTPTGDKTSSFLIFSGNLASGVTVTARSLTFDTRNSQFLGELKLLANGMETDLFYVLNQLSKLKICISEWLNKHEKPKIKLVKGKTLVLSIRHQK